MGKLQKIHPVRGKSSVATVSSNGGYIALTSAIIISLILVGLTFAVSASGYFARFNGLNGEYKRISKGLAESCVNTALLEIAKNPDYSGNQSDVSVGPNTTCDIKTVIYYNPDTSSGCLNPTSGYDLNEQKVACITTQADYQGAFSNMTITAKVQNPNVVYVITTTLVVSVSVDQLKPGDSLEDFHLTLNGDSITSGQINTVQAGVPYTANVASAPSGYSTSGWYCNGTGGATITPDPGSANSCYIYYTVQPTTAKLTLIANVTPSGGTPTLQIKNNTTGDTQTVDSGQTLEEPAGVVYTAIATTPTGYQASPWSGACNPATGITGSLVAGQGYVCVINFTEINMGCADTVMMLDRTKSLFEDPANPNAPADEANAAKSLLNLYSGVSPIPQVGIGSFGGLDQDDGTATVPITGQLTNSYGTDTDTNTGPNYPTATTTPNNYWKDAANAFSDDALFATDFTNGHYQGYSKFGFNIPSESIIHGIEVTADGFSAVPLSPNGIGNYNDWSVTPVASSSYAVVSDNSNSTYIIGVAVNTAQTFAIPSSAIPAGSTINSVTLKMNAKQGNTTGNSPQIKFRIEKGIGLGEQNDVGENGSSNPVILTSTFTTYGSGAMSKNPFTNDIWQLSDFDTVRFGVIKTNSDGRAWVSKVYLEVNYTPSSSGQIGVNLSWNNGASWTNPQKTVNLTGAEAEYTLGGVFDTWGKTWTANDFSDANFVLRVQNKSATGVKVALNYVKVKVYYAADLYGTVNLMMNNNSAGNTKVDSAISAGNTELNSFRHDINRKKVLVLISDGVPGATSFDANLARLALEQADAAKSGADPTEIFAMFFGTDPSGTIPTEGKQFLAALTTGIFIPSASISSASRSGTTVTITTTATHKFVIGQKIQVSGVSNPVFNGTFYITNVTATNKFTYKTTSSGTASGSGGMAVSLNQPGSVYDTDATENTDGDHFFISPTSDAMQGIFQTIGTTVCPAAAGAAQAKMNVNTYVIGGTAQPDDFHITISGGDAVPNSFDGSVSGTTVTVSSGVSFSISETGPLGYYYPPQYINCPTSIIAGQTVYCTIINSDMPPQSIPPPPPPPPSANIIIGTWVEQPTSGP